MKEEKNLEKFIDAQKDDYPIALEEIRRGKKETHWMWYIFPQIHSLGITETSKKYAIRNLEEADEYLKHPVLGKRLVEISQALLNQSVNDATEIFGTPDDLKLKSSMTLFALLKETDPVFQLVLERFFNGLRDNRTEKIISENL